MNLSDSDDSDHDWIRSCCIFQGEITSSYYACSDILILCILANLY